MKKVLFFVAAMAFAATVQAASIGWSLAGAGNYSGSKYMFFVVGQNGVTSVEAIRAMLEAGESLDGYEFGSGKVAANGAATVVAASSGKSLDAGTYESFMVIFDSADPTTGSSKYTIVSGGAKQTKTVSPTAGTLSFVAGNQSTYLNDASNWSTYGGVPEPTSAMLMLVGLAGLALRRKRA